MSAPNTSRTPVQVPFLPIFPGMTEREIEHVVRAVADVSKAYAQ
jgi:dTDP-4-amino-4,6-dideoxygalactose transaminase